MSLDDDNDEFWQDAKAKPKAEDAPRFDPESGRFLQKQTIRFFEARLRPDSTRTLEEAEKIAEELEEAFLYEGMSHNNATAASPHQVTIESFDTFDQIRDAVFSVNDVYDVVFNSKSHLRDPSATPFAKLWKAEFGSEPEPLAERFEKMPKGALPDYLAESLAAGKATPEFEEMLQEAFDGKTGIAKRFRAQAEDMKINFGQAGAAKGQEKAEQEEGGKEKGGEEGGKKKAKKSKKKAKKAKRVVEDEF